MAYRGSNSIVHQHTPHRPPSTSPAPQPNMNIQCPLRLDSSGATPETPTIQLFLPTSLAKTWMTRQELSPSNSDRVANICTTDQKTRISL
ncbi:hypothetical protein PCASD_01753 [Puccinia coronata f. sp. avenae]|uniref:Uncharacterized protein n=1 Tax=Puccinia coronata f. sp. avenae TaxID=200324 RepID=A0A2N5VJZ7_9BASI|nr:hypothetical protein PCASD_01753 [Puccinia coronata f. sp. avenae]